MRDSQNEDVVSRSSADLTDAYWFLRFLRLNSNSVL